MIQSEMFNNELDALRRCIVFYAAISAETINKTFSTKALETITFQKIRRDLFPIIFSWTLKSFNVQEKIIGIRHYLNTLMTLTDEEREFMDRFESKEYRPELLFKDEAIIERIKNHPMALWKCR
jgi:hypothetical protein